MIVSFHEASSKAYQSYSTSTVVVQYQYWYWTVLGVVLSSLGGWPLGDHSKKYY